MEKLPHLPKSQASFRRPSPISPSSYRILKQALVTRNTSKFMNLSGTLRNQSLLNQDEIPELSFQLATLRKSLDKYSISNFHKENRLRELQFVLKELKDSQTVKYEEIQMRNHYKDVKVQIGDVALSMADEIEDQKMLENIQERMRLTKAFHEKKEKKLKKKLEAVSYYLETQMKLRKETLDSVNQYRNLYKTALGQVEFEKSELKQEILRMENHSALKKKLLEKTEEHNKHRLEIVELTMIEERSAHLDDIRNSKMLHFCFDQLFRKKLAKEKIVFNKLNEAFMKVKIQTGLQDVEDMIEKFLTQEFNYQELIKNLQIKEIKCEDYKLKILNIQNQVDHLSQQKRFQAHHTEIHQILQKVTRLKEKKNELNNVRMLMAAWIENAWKKMKLPMENAENLTLKEKYLIFGKEIVKIIKEYIGLGKHEENEVKRKKVKVQEIMQIYLAMNVFKVRNKQSVVDKVFRSISKGK